MAGLSFVSLLMSASEDKSTVFRGAQIGLRITDMRQHGPQALTTGEGRSPTFNNR
jgi:hypothetical protein